MYYLQIKGQFFKKHLQQSWRVLWRAVWFIWVKSSKFLKCSWLPMSVTQKYTCMSKHLSLGLLTSIKRPVFLCISLSILFEVLCKNEHCEWGNYIFCFRCWKTASPVVVLVFSFDVHTCSLILLKWLSFVLTYFFGRY